jgi:hypothetical protein
MNYSSAERRYLNDPMFHALVTTMEQAMAQLQLTPSEIREAATYAAIRFESSRVASFPWPLRP